MKFTVEIEEFWMDEDAGTLDEQLKSYIVHDVLMQIKKDIKEKIETEISFQVKQQFEHCMYEYIQKEVKDFISEGKIRTSSYNKEEILIKDWIKERFTGDTGYNNPEQVIKSLAKDFGKEMKERYDLLFASQLVAKMSETGLLKEDVAKLLLPKKE